MAQEIDLLAIFAEDKQMMLYRPGWRKITGSVTATILLHQILFHWNKNKRQPFYKFKAPCEHQLYKPDDSWIEELGFSREEFDSALKKIAIRVTKRKGKTITPPHDRPVEYNIEPSRLTFYTINETNLRRLLLTMYTQETDMPCKNGHCPVKRESHFTETGNPAFDLLEDQRGSSEKEISSEREERPALALFVEKFPSVMLSNRRKQDIPETATNLDAWKLTLQWWELKGYRAEHTENMLDYYQNKAIPRLTACASAGTPGHHDGKGNGNSHPEPAGSPWAQILQRLQRRINAPSFDTWLRPVAATFTDHTMTLAVPDDVFEYWLRQNYLETIRDEAQQVLGFPPQMTFVREAVTA